MRTFAITCFLLSLCLVPAFSQTDGGKKYGRVEFANSGAPAAQADFLEGMALLHDFEYNLAADAFRRAQAADPGFAMAYWGEAMTHNHPIWFQQNLTAGRAALAKLAPTPAERLAKAKTEREKAYLRTLDVLYGDGGKEERDFLYERSMADLHARYPHDVDASAFYGLAILGTAHAGRDIATYMRAAGVLEEAWIAHQDHPGLVHYLIHSYDDPVHAPLGLRAARIYAKIAPDAGHAQHMTSHIFVALGMWPEVIQANINGIAVVNAVRKAAGKIPLGCGHYPSWLGYGYLQLGQMDKAQNAVAQCRVMLDSPTTDTKNSQTSMDPDDSFSGSYANMRLRYLIDTGSWPADMAGWQLPKTAGPGTRLDFEFARVLNELMRGHHEEAVTAMKELDAAAAQVIDLETKGDNPDPTYRIRADILKLEAQALLAEVDKDLAGAERLLSQAVTLEEKLPTAFGPPVIDKPTHELFGEFLLRRGRDQEAHEQFKKALAHTPGRRLAEQGFDSTSNKMPPK